MAIIVKLGVAGNVAVVLLREAVLRPRRAVPEYRSRGQTEP
jgi:hypothetical protein